MMVRRKWISALLATLVVLNVLWWLLAGRVAPTFAAAAYLVVLLLVLSRGEYRAAMLAGLAGFALHLAEAATGAVGRLGSGERALFAANLILPLVVGVLALLESRRGRGQRCA